MARYEERVSAWMQGGDIALPCTSGHTPCPAEATDAGGLHARWERAIARLQGAVACSPACPLADHLLAVVADLGRMSNPLAEVFPELDPAPQRRRAVVR